MPEQLPLAVNLPDDETFSSFVEGSNTQLVGHLRQVVKVISSPVATEPTQPVPFLSFISGEAGYGKSHLLYALCHLANSCSRSHIYLNMNTCLEYDVSMLEGLETVELICLDDIQALKGHKEWQVALFDLINRVKEQGRSHLVISANSGPSALELELPDLRSRLAWGVSFSIQPLDDEQRCSALINRAEQRGLNMTTDVARYLITHCQRDMPNLMAALQTLDKCSLQAQRKLTIPFVKQALDI